MAKAVYKAGDTVILKPRSLAEQQPRGTGRISSLLPDVQGVPQYRVRFQHENCERHIGQGDIDMSQSFASFENGTSMPSDASSVSWINPRAIKIKK